MVFGKKCNYSFMYNNKCLDIVDNYKYLGLMFKSVSRCDSNIFSDAFDYIQNQGRKASFKVLKDSKKIGILPPKVAFKLFDALILPILEYGSEIWFQNREVCNIESIHTKYIKTILGVHTNSSNLAVYGECGRYPLIVRQKLKVMKYWYKILNKPSDSIVVKMYNVLCNLNEAGFTNWTSHIENMLCEYDMKDVWDRQQCNKYIIKRFKISLYKSYEQFWLKSVQNIDVNPKLRTYCTFKCVFKMESYLLDLPDFKMRKLLTRFRISNHCLSIEKGRHTKPKTPVEKRICIVCDTKAIEDEDHFLCKCPLYTDLRREFIENCDRLGFYGCNENFNLKYLLNITGISFYLCKLLNKMYIARQTKMSTQS